MKCSGVTKKGSPCSFVAEAPSEYCVLHDPSRVEERRRLFSERGKAGAAKAKQQRADRKAAIHEQLYVRSLEGLQKLLEHALRNAATSHQWNTVIAGVRVGAELLKVGQYEERLAELEAMVKRSEETNLWPQ